MLDGQECDDGFDAAGSAGGVTRVGLDGGDGRNAVAKESHGSEALGEIIVGCAGAVRIDVIDVVGGEPGVLNGLLHDQIGTEAVGRGGRWVVGIAGVGRAGESADGADTTRSGVFGRFEDYVPCPFAEIDASAVAIEGSADVRIEDFEGIEAVDVVTREAFAAPGHNHIGAPRAKKLSALHERVGR